MKENKQLTRKEEPKISASADGLSGTLARVEVEVPREYPIAQSDREEALIEYGRMRESFAHSSLSNFTFITHLKKIKTGKLYKEYGFPSFEAFVEKTFRLSKDTVDSRIKEFDQFGPNLGEFLEIADVTREALHRVNPELTGDGYVAFGGKRFKLNTANAEAIQLAFLEQDRELKLRAETISSQASQIKQAREQRDAERKARAEDRRRQHALADSFANADPDLKILLRAQVDFDKTMLLLNKLTERELSEENKSNYLELSRRIRYRADILLDHAQTLVTAHFDPSNIDSAFESITSSKPRQ
jgi:hypothetical protein